MALRAVLWLQLWLVIFVLFDFIIVSSLSSIPLIHSLFDVRNLITLAMYLIIFGLIFYCYYDRSERARKSLLVLLFSSHSSAPERLFVSIALFGAPFIALSNIFFTVGCVLLARLWRNDVWLATQLDDRWTIALHAVDWILFDLWWPICRHNRFLSASIRTQIGFVARRHRHNHCVRCTCLICVYVCW